MAFDGWHDHSKDMIEGVHAILSPSDYYWINYDDDKLIERKTTKDAANKGTKLHNIAKELIEEKIKLPRSNKTLNSYVNDAIGFKLRPEQPVKYSGYCFGWADTMDFKEKQNLLRIHDLKTGIKVPAKLTQLEIYAAIWCLEYDVRPKDIDIELRIYQFDDILIGNPSPDIIVSHMEQIIHASELYRRLDSSRGE